MRFRNDTSGLPGDVLLLGYRERLSTSHNCVFAVAESPVEDSERSSHDPTGRFAHKVK